MRDRPWPWRGGLVGACVLAAAASGVGAPQPGPLSPAEALSAFAVRPGFTVELVAAEPLTMDPVAIDWGPDGKLWVVEMADYPLGMDNHGKPGGRVRYLESTRGDGRYDKSTVFLDNLEYPSGVMAWGKGVLVTCAPTLFYAEDTDGDGRADVRRVLFTGFGEVNPQHRVNGLRWGLDNWIHCANGDFATVRPRPVGPAGPTAHGTPFSAAEDVARLVHSGAAVRSARTGAVVDIRNRDFRFRVDGTLDPETGQSQYGRDRDDWDNWFGCNNAQPMWHFALADHYLRRNPFVPSPTPRVDAPPAVTYTVGPVGRDTGTRRNPQGNAFTSGCGIGLYRDDLFGPAFAENWFVCEPVHNLVHREVLVPTGATFSSRRAADEPRSEFLASSDTWFSPTMVRTGPDGALWVVDMYRKVLEHPNWIPGNWRGKIDVRAGDDKGRIYRVYPTGMQPRPIPRLDRLDTAGLVAALDSPNGWQRDTAQQMLIRRRDRSAVPRLEKRATTSQRALCRLHSLCTLDGLDALSPDVLLAGLADAHPGVRRHAIRLCETRLASHPDLGAALARLASDPDAQVRIQVAYSLGAWDDSHAGAVLGQLLLRETGEPYITAAALSSLTRGNVAAAARALRAGSHGAPPPLLVENLLRSASGFKAWHATADLLAWVSTAAGGRYAAWQLAALAGFLDALDQRNTSLARLAGEGGPPLQAAAGRVDAALGSARALAGDTQAPPELRVAAVGLLGRDPGSRPQDAEALAALLAPQTPPEVQLAAADALGRQRGDETGALLLRGWKGYGPGLRAQVLDLLARREAWTRALLDALEHKDVAAAELDAARRKRLLEHPTAALRDRATRLLGGAVNPDRQKVVEAYRSALTLAGDAGQGRVLFGKHCATCHRLGDVGHAVGPDLAMVRDKPPDWLLTAILDPNQAVEGRYVNYVAVTRAGLTLTGVLTNEGSTSVTLTGPEGKAQVILRADLEELASTGKSAMPEGLEKDVRPQDVADLIAYLRTSGAK